MLNSGRPRGLKRRNRQRIDPPCEQRSPNHFFFLIRPIPLWGTHLRVISAVLPAVSRGACAMVKARSSDSCLSPSLHSAGNLLAFSESWSPFRHLSELRPWEGNEMEEIKDEIPDEQHVLELGIMLGQRRAFGML